MKFEIKKGAFFKTSNILKNSKSLIFYILLVDIAFLIVFLFSSMAYGSFSKNLLNYQNLSLLFFSFIVYNLILILIYSLSKFFVLYLIKSSFSGKKLNFNRFCKFYLLNIIIFLILFILLLILSVIAQSMVEKISPFASLIVMILYALFSYVFVNISQILFNEGKKISSCLRMALKFFGKIRHYYGVIVVLILTVALIQLLSMPIVSRFDYTIFQGDLFSVFKLGNIYSKSFAVVGLIIIPYIAILFNRFYFYCIVKEKLL